MLMTKTDMLPKRKCSSLSRQKHLYKEDTTLPKYRLEVYLVDRLYYSARSGRVFEKARLHFLRDRFEPHDFIILEAVGIIFVRFSEQGTVGKRRELRQPDVVSQASKCQLKNM